MEQQLGNGAQILKHSLKTLIKGQGWNQIKTWLITNLIYIAPTPKQDEDCLNLTLRTPSLETSAKLPVMVWIHGGDHHDGSGFDPFFTGNEIAKKEVVFVSINYRLGLFGYFTHPELKKESPNNVCGNYGLLDQITALKWVKDNIENFGGDPENVTLFGQSAGGESIANLMTSPMASRLFHKAIMQSPANSGQMYHLSEPFLDNPSAEEVATQFAARVGVSGENQIEQLRKFSAKELQEIATNETRIGCFYPTIDGHVLPESPFSAFYHGNQAKVPLIVGSTGNEGTLIHPIFPSPIVEFRYRDTQPDKMPAYMQEEFPEDIEQLKTLYPGLETRETIAEQNFLGDMMFGVKSRFYAEHAAKSSSPTFLYLFDRKPPSQTQTAGAFHGSELSFVHGISTPILPLTKNDLSLSRMMISFWTQFAKTGAPGESDGKIWGAFSPEDPNWMLFDTGRSQMEPVSRESNIRF